MWCVMFLMILLTTNKMVLCPWIIQMVIYYLLIISKVLAWNLLSIATVTKASTFFPVQYRALNFAFGLLGYIMSILRMQWSMSSVLCGGLENHRITSGYVYLTIPNMDETSQVCILVVSITENSVLHKNRYILPIPRSMCLCVCVCISYVKPYTWMHIIM